MILFEQGACKKIEAIRIFHYLQQIEKDWRTILCHPRLKKLLINEVLTVSPASAQLLEPYNNDYELTDEEFGTLVALCLNEPVTNDAEIMSFRKEVEDILYQKYHQKNYKILLSANSVLELNGEEDINYFRGTLLAYEYEIGYNLANFPQLQFEALLTKINLCLSIISCNSFSPYYVIARYNKLIDGGLVDKLFYFLQQGNTLRAGDYLKCICLVYKCLRFTALRDKLQMSILFKPTSWRILLGFFKMCDIIEIVYYMSKHVPAFNKFLLEQGAVQQFICDSQILPESVLYIYNNIVSTYAAALPRMLVGKDDVLFIYKYSVSALINCGNNTSIMVASLTLIVEIVKTAQFELYELESLDVVLNAFKCTDVSVVTNTLRILEAALKVKNIAIVKMFLTDRLFIAFIDNIFRQQCLYDIRWGGLELFYYLTAPDTIKFVFNNDLIAHLKAVSYYKPDSHTMVSNIVLKIVQQSVNSDLFLMQLHDNNIMGLLCKLFRESIRQSHDDPNVCFANKQVLVNVFESLHLLSVGTSKKLPRTRKTNLNIFHMNISVALLEDFLESIKDLFNAPESLQEFLQRFLLEKSNLNSQTSLSPKMKIFYLIQYVMYQLIFHSRNNNLPTLKKIFSVRNLFHRRFYELLKTSYLLSSKFPINLKLSFSIDQSRYTRYVPYDYTFEYINIYLRDFCMALQNRELYENEELRVFVINLDYYPRYIKSSLTYVSIVEAILKDYSLSKFRLYLRVYCKSEQYEKASRNVYINNWPKFPTQQTRIERNYYRQTHDVRYGRNILPDLDRKSSRLGLNMTRHTTQSRNRSQSPYFNKRY